VLRLVKPLLLFVFALGLVGLASIALQDWAVSRNAVHMETREAHIPYGAAEVSLGSSSAPAN
jgi:hypothetical protein